MKQMTEQMMESLLVRMGEFHKETMAEIRTNQLTMQEEMDSIQEKIIAKMGTHQERLEANMNAW
jgi:ketol-acid reductoisomerase